MKILSISHPAPALFLLFISIFPCGGYCQPADSIFSFHAQTTIIRQFKPAFTAKYTGANSLRTGEEGKSSLTSTLYSAMRLWKGATICLNPEIAGGSGLSGALGVAASSNGETFRVGDPAPAIYLARLFLSQEFALSGEFEYRHDDFNQPAGKYPLSYIGIHAGKISVADFFDDNTYSHDPRTRFMSWGLMGNGAWDYPANTRGYTPGIIFEYVSPLREVCYAAALLPEDANGSDMNTSIGKSSAHSLEYTMNITHGSKAGVLRLLFFLNTAGLGSYRESIGEKPVFPDITSTRKYGRTKYGFTLNTEQEINDFMGCFLRAGWNDGQNETWTYTEIDRTLSMGISARGGRWNRTGDHAGAGFVVSGLSKPHRDYLRAGGKGFILGDGYLSYAYENLAEVYYSSELVKNNIFLSAAYQFLLHPGYNSDRGPVNIFSVRLHARI